MFLAAWLIGGVVLVFVLFSFLQRRSDKAYRPTAKEIKELITASIEGRLSLGAFDEFSRVRIAYNKQLDDLRERYNAIVDNRAYIEGEITNANSTPLNDAGKRKLLALVEELEQLIAGSAVQAP